MSVDLATKIISTVVPAIVAECARRFDEMQNHKDGNYMSLVEKISGELVDECDFDDAEDEHGCDYGSETIFDDVPSELSHIQNLKFDINDLLRDFRGQIDERMEEMKDAIKTELRMEMYMELEKLKKVKTDAPKPKAPPGGMAEFTFDIQPVNEIAPIFKGYDSISDKVSFANREDVLKDNPIYAMVTRGLDRVKSGKAAYTAEELIEARGDRFDHESLTTFRSRVEQSNTDYESDQSEDERWGKLLYDKFASDN